MFNMRNAAVAAVSLAAVQAASAGFVLQTASRGVSVSSMGSVVDSDSNNMFDAWFGSASTSGMGYSALATQGSNLSYSEMTFVGAAQTSASMPAMLGAMSMVDVVFAADANESISWIVGLGESFGENGVAFASVVVTDLTTGVIRLAMSSDAAGSGSFDVIAGRQYRVEIKASASNDGTGEYFANYNVGFTSIPQPGAIALLGLAGLVARRRR
ncbi:MAG: hypothetical protein RI967_16 [Planctomycetota bacterium]